MEMSNKLLDSARDIVQKKLEDTVWGSFPDIWTIMVPKKSCLCGRCQVQVVWFPIPLNLDTLKSLMKDPNYQHLKEESVLLAPADIDISMEDLCARWNDMQLGWDKLPC